MSICKKVVSFSLLFPFILSPVFAQNYKGEVLNNYKEEVPIPSIPTEPMYGCSATKYLCDGLYFGVGGSYDIYKVRINTSFTPDEVVITSLNPGLSARGWDGRLFVGFGMYYEWFYLGAEFMGEATNAESSFSTTITTIDGPTVYSAKFKGRAGFGPGLLLGVKVNDATLLYGRVGYIRSKFQSTVTVSSPLLNASVRKSKWGNGLNYGLGLETAIAQHVSLRTEYTYTSYHSISNSNGTKFSPANNQFVVDLIYHLA